MRHRFEALLPDPSDTPPITTVGSAEIIIPEDIQYAWKYLDLGLYFVKYGERDGVHWKLNVPRGTMVAHINEEEHLTLVRNFRYPLIEVNENGEVIDNGISFELPGGGVDLADIEHIKHAPHEEALRILGYNAIREFEEEIGVRLSIDDLTHLSTTRLSVGVSNLRIDAFHAEGGLPSEQCLDDGEQNLKVFRVPLYDAYEMIEAGLIRESATTGVVRELIHEYDVPVKKKLNLKKHSFPKK